MDSSLFSKWHSQLLSQAAPAPRFLEAGKVTAVGDGVAIVTGLERALSDELVRFASGIEGVVLDLEPGRMGVILLGPSEQVQVGEEVFRTNQVISTPVGNRLLGRIVNALGQPLDNQGALISETLRDIEMPAPGVLQRRPIYRSLATGFKAIDAAIPVGLGQRQLIIGDRQTGKTSVAIDTMLNQKNSQVLCIYCAIGQRGDAVARVINALEQNQMLERSIVMVAGDEQAPGLAYIAPFAAMSMAEYFALQGQDVLVIFDDMTHHARAYRELSLLLRRPPGREAFPGDIFYLHARLLERAGQFNDELGGGSITALPVVETEAENLSAYIPTNLISITDGQIYLSPRLVQKNQFPAVDLGLSVSRVGGKAQIKAMRQISGNLRVLLSQFEELEEFARFGTRLDDATKARLARGQALRAALRQAERDPMRVIEQLAVLLAAMEGLLDNLDEQRTLASLNAIRAAAVRHLNELEEKALANQPLSEEEKQHLLTLAREALLNVKVE